MGGAAHGDELSDAARSAVTKIAAVLPAERKSRLEDDALIIGPVESGRSMSN